LPSAQLSCTSSVPPSTCSCPCRSSAKPVLRALVFALFFGRSRASIAPRCAPSFPHRGSRCASHSDAEGCAARDEQRDHQQMLPKTGKRRKRVARVAGPRPARGNGEPPIRPSRPESLHSKKRVTNPVSGTDSRNREFFSQALVERHERGKNELRGYPTELRSLGVLF